MAFDFAGRRSHCDGGCGVELVAGALVAVRGAAFSCPDEKQILLGIVVGSAPYGAPAILPLIALRPGFAAWLSGRWNRKCSPQLLAGAGVEGGDKAADAALATGRSHENFSVGDQRSHGDVVTVLVLLDFRGPCFHAGFRIDGNQHCFANGEEHLVAIKRHAAARLVRHQGAFGRWSSEAPEYSSGL